MNHRYVVAYDYRPGCRLFHGESNSKKEAETSLSQLKERLRLQQREHKLIRADIYQLSQNCLHTFRLGFNTKLFEVILIDGNILHALITEPIEASGNRSGTFQMTLAHAKTKPGIYPWAVNL